MEHIIFDIEITTHCNATCTFCPRDSVPFLKHMEWPTVERVIERLLELPNKPTITFCGTGDCSTHPQLVKIVDKFTKIFPRFQITTNGLRIDEEYTHKLLDAGLRTIIFSVSEIEPTAYKSVYGHSFEKLLKNVMYFHKAAEGKCKVIIAPLARKRFDPKVKQLKTFWRQKGLSDFLVMDITNRAGALDQSYSGKSEAEGLSQAFASDKTLGLCLSPFTSSLIGPDGGYYLCSLDFKKQRIFGSVFTHSIFESWQLKQKYFQDDRQVCASCSANPLSKLADAYPDVTVSKYRALLEKDSKANNLKIWGFNIKAQIEEINNRLENRHQEVIASSEKIYLHGKMYTLVESVK